MTESQIQKAVFDNLRSRAWPDVVWWHHPNDQASRRKSGFLAGVSDVLCLHKGKFYALELKKDGGRASLEQLEFIHAAQRAGGLGCVAEGLDEAIYILEAWGILRVAA